MEEACQEQHFAGRPASEDYQKRISDQDAFIDKLCRALSMSHCLSSPLIIANYICCSSTGGVSIM